MDVRIHLSSLPKLGWQFPQRFSCSIIVLCNWCESKIWHTAAGPWSGPIRSVRSDLLTRTEVDIPIRFLQRWRVWRSFYVFSFCVSWLNSVLLGQFIITVLLQLGGRSNLSDAAADYFITSTEPTLSAPVFSGPSEDVRLSTSSLQPWVCSWCNNNLAVAVNTRFLFHLRITELWGSQSVCVWRGGWREVLSVPKIRTLSTSPFCSPGVSPTLKKHSTGRRRNLTKVTALSDSW